MSAARPPEGGEATHHPLWVRLRAEGAQRLDPLRFRYLEQLVQRLPSAAEPVQRLLQGRFDAALADYATRWDAAQQAEREALAALSAQHPAQARALRRLFAAGDYRGMRQLARRTAHEAAARPLAQLARRGRDDEAAGPREGAAAGRPEMHSVRRFRESWSRIAAHEAVEQAIGRAPANAGPLNSQVLALRSLAWMRELSPAYLARFLAHAQALLWLDEAVPLRAPPETRPARGGRARPRK